MENKIKVNSFILILFSQNTLYGVPQNNQLVNTIPYFFTLAGKADVILQQMVSVFLDICKIIFSAIFLQLKRE